MLNKVLVFFSEIIHNTWQWSHMTLLPPPPARESPYTHTQILISAAVQRVCDRGAQSTVTF